MKVCILQPSYLPWLGYFALIDNVDTFVFLDDVQLVKRSWHRRNRIRLKDDNWMWLTVPIKKMGKRYNELIINKVEINNELPWADKHWKSIQHAYASAENFSRYSKKFEEIYNRNWKLLIDLNLNIINLAKEILGITGVKFELASTMSTEGYKTDLLLNILHNFNADTYVSGPMARDYIDTNKFKAANIEIEWFEYEHPTYRQDGKQFIPYMSIIDLIFNEGPNSLKILRTGAQRVPSNE